MDLEIRHLRLVAGIADGRVDLAILIDPARDKRLRLRPLFGDEMIAIVAKDDPLAKRRWVSAEDLAAQHLLLYAPVPKVPRQGFATDARKP